MLAPVAGPHAGGAIAVSRESTALSAASDGVYVPSEHADVTKTSSDSRHDCIKFVRMKAHTIARCEPRQAQLGDG
jgi:hypothetical protein